IENVGGDSKLTGDLAIGQRAGDRVGVWKILDRDEVMRTDTLGEQPPETLREGARGPGRGGIGGGRGFGVRPGFPGRRGHAPAAAGFRTYSGPWKRYPCARCTPSRFTASNSS